MWIKVTIFLGYVEMWTTTVPGRFVKDSFTVVRPPAAVAQQILRTGCLDLKIELELLDAPPVTQVDTGAEKSDNDQGVTHARKCRTES